MVHKMVRSLALEVLSVMGLEIQRKLCINRWYWNSLAVFLSACLFLNITTDILLGTHWENGAVVFWSHAVNLPLASNAIISWKFCHMIHKLLRDGHPNVSPSNLSNTWHQVLNILEMGVTVYRYDYWNEKIWSIFVVYIILGYYRKHVAHWTVCRL